MFLSCHSHYREYRFIYEFRFSKLVFKKPYVKRFMYSKKNKTKDNYQTRGCKNRLISLLVMQQWELKTNTINGEYRIPKKLSNGHQYCLDSYFISPIGKHYDIEYNGQYHFTPRQMQKTLFREDWLKNYFNKLGIKINIAYFLPDEVFSKYQLTKDELMHRIIHCEMYRPF